VSTGNSAKTVRWTPVIYGLSTSGAHVYADVEFVAWRMVSCDPKENGGLLQRPSFFYLTEQGKPVRFCLDYLLQGGMTLRELSLAAVEEALCHLFTLPAQPIPPYPIDEMKDRIAKLPPSQRGKAMAKLADVRGVLKTWRA